MVAPQVVVIDELGQGLFELTWQVVVFEQDLVLQGAVIALDLALGHRVIELATGVRHAVLREPGPELSGEVGRAVLAMALLERKELRFESGADPRWRGRGEG